MPPVQPHDPADGICVDPATPAASLPQPQRGFAAFGDFQLRSPWPGQVLEADRAELFKVVVPGAAAVAVGCEELGWQELAPAAGTAAAVLGDAARDPAEMQGESTAEQGRSSNSSREGRVQPGLFRGTVVLPRREKCYVAARSAGAGVQQGNSSWMPIVSLQVVPQVRLLPDTISCCSSNQTFLPHRHSFNIEGMTPALCRDPHFPSSLRQLLVSDLTPWHLACPGLPWHVLLQVQHLVAVHI